MLLDQTQKFAIKLNDDIVVQYSTQNEAVAALTALRATNPLYESASVVVVDLNNKELLLG